MAKRRRREPEWHIAKQSLSGKFRSHESAGFAGIPNDWRDAAHRLNLTHGTRLVLEALTRQIRYCITVKGMPAGLKDEEKANYATLETEAKEKAACVTVPVVEKVLAADASVSDSTVQRALDVLEPMGIIKAVTPRRLGDTTGTVWLIADAAEMLAAVGGARPLDERVKQVRQDFGIEVPEGQDMPLGPTHKSDRNKSTVTPTTKMSVVNGADDSRPQSECMQRSSQDACSAAVKTTVAEGETATPLQSGCMHPYSQDDCTPTVRMTAPLQSSCSEPETGSSMVTNRHSVGIGRSSKTARTCKKDRKTGKGKPGIEILLSTFKREGDGASCTPRRTGVAIPSDERVDDCYSIAVRNAKLVGRLIQNGQAAPPAWYSGASPVFDPGAVGALIESLRNEGVDPVLWFALACWVADATELASFASIATPSIGWLLRGVMRNVPSDALWSLVSRPDGVGQAPGLLEQAALALPAGGLKARRRSPQPNDATEIGLYSKWFGWLAGARDQIAAFGPARYWEARYRAWSTYSDVIKRRDPGCATYYPSLWDLIDRTPDPLTHPAAIPLPREPLHRFLGIRDDVEIPYVAAGFRMNPMHEAAAINAYRGAGPRLKGTFDDIMSVGGISYAVRSGDTYQAPHHYPQEVILQITPANFARFAALFSNEQELHHWWFVKPISRGAPPLEIYREFGYVAALDENDNWMGRKVNWGKTL